MAASRLASTSSGGFVAAGEPPAMAAPGASTDFDAFSTAVAVLPEHELCHPGSEQQIQEGFMPMLGTAGRAVQRGGHLRPWPPPSTRTCDSGQAALWLDCC